MPDNSQETDDKDYAADSRENLGLHLWQAQHAVERAMDNALHSLGIRVTQGAALVHLHQQPGLSGAELARRLHVSPQSAATLLANFEERGWVKRMSHPIHRGVRETELTTSGRAIMHDCTEIINKINGVIGQTMTKKELGLLHDLIERCLKSAQKLIGS